MDDPFNSLIVPILIVAIFAPLMLLLTNFLFQWSVKVNLRWKLKYWYGYKTIVVAYYGAFLAKLIIDLFDFYFPLHIATPEQALVYAVLWELVEITLTLMVHSWVVKVRLRIRFAQAFAVSLLYILMIACGIILTFFLIGPLFGLLIS